MSGAELILTIVGIVVRGVLALAMLVVAIMATIDDIKRSRRYK